ncbi:MAG: carboxypeptidase regulatory-like domain-containing protein [Bryobacterales bacterium]|nr:carboxypeptidase regulatory-like domain-containing protein [Bryobacterales bacterium]
MPARLNLALRVCLLAGAAVNAMGQMPIGSIAGTVADESGAVISGAAVTVENKATGMKRELKTGEDGTFSAPALPAGQYEVRGSATGFRQTIREAQVLTGSTTTVDLKMIVGAVTESVEVSGTASQINYDGHQIDGVIQREEIENLPLNGRSFLQLAFLEPGVGVGTKSLAQYNAQFSVSVLGGDSSMTAITVDGGNVRNALEGNTSQNFSQEIVQEFQVSSANFDLSTGIAAGGAVNIVTRSGGNQFHGSGYYFFRDHHLSAYPALGRNSFNPDPFFARRQSGFLLSGPIKKDKLFFFFNLENNNQDSVVTVQPTSPYFSNLAGNYSSPYNALQPSIKFDYRINDTNTAFLRYSHDGNNSFGPRGGITLPSDWLVNTNRADQGVVGWTSTIGAAVVNDLRFAFQYWGNENLFPTEKECPGCLGLGFPYVSIQGSGVTLGNTTNAPQGRVIRRYNIVESLNWQKGSHRMRFGGSYETMPFSGYWAFGEPAATQVFGPDLLAQNRIPPALWGLPNQFTSNADLLKLPLQAFALGIGDPSQPPPYNAQNARNNRRYQLYWQDTWHVHPRFTLNYGLGWQFESTLTNHDLDKPALLAPIMDSLEATGNSYRNFSPSLGFAWNLGKDNKTVVRGGFGIYYDTRELSQRLGERSEIGPVGNGRQQIISTGIPNPLPTIPSPAPGVLPAVPTGAPLFFTLPTGFTLGTLMQILPQVQASVQAQLANPNPNDLSVRNINITKQGSDLFQHYYPASYSRHMGIGIQREVVPNLVASADFVYRHFFHQEVGDIDYNLFNSVRGPIIPKCSGAQASNPAANCSTGPIEFRAPIGRTDYKALLVKIDKRFAQRYQFTASYAMVRQYGLNGINNAYNWFEGWGPQAGRHNLNVSGIIDLPGKIQFSFISAISSKGPYRPSVSSVDLDGDGLDTAFLPGWTVPDRHPTREKLQAAVDAWNGQHPDLPNGQRPRTPRNQVIPKLTLPANYSFGENFFSQDIRLTKWFLFHERYKLNLFIESFNVFNVANLGGISSTVNGSGFGVPTSRAGQVFGSGGPRAFQLGGRFSF